jgi:hypothetical protein
MWDSFSGANIDVRVDERCGPYIMIEPAKLGPIEELFQRHGIPFKVEEEGADACKGAPEAAVIEFGKEADPGSIQRVLDSVP